MCVRVHVFMWFCRQYLVRSHCCEDILDGSLTISGLFRGYDFRIYVRIVVRGLWIVEMVKVKG